MRNCNDRGGKIGCRTIMTALNSNRLHTVVTENKDSSVFGFKSHSEISISAADSAYFPKAPCRL
jgi:hypothetical protein